MKKFAVLALIAAIVVANLILSGMNIWLGLTLSGTALAIAAIGDAASEKKSSKRSVSMSKAARQQRELAQA